jgi:hypothetical protein
LVEGVGFARSGILLDINTDNSSCSNVGEAVENGLQEVGRKLGRVDYLGARGGVMDDPVGVISEGMDMRKMSISGWS